jgi:hypothetical protein
VQSERLGKVCVVRDGGGERGASLAGDKYSDETTSEPAIEATPQGAATSGNQFVLKGGEWHFNLDTKASGLSTGIWQLVATLSDGSQHSAWIQIK